jgi:ribosomal protein S18 acetylase RimI-like enzyme
MATTLRPMSEDEFAQWLPKVRDFYAQDIASNGGATEDEARRKSIEDTERLFPGGQPSADQLVFVIEADGERVGELWLCERETGLGHGLWVYDVHVEDANRGRGYGKAAMLLAEAEARRRGLDRIALNVFGGNEIARNLYRSLGYAENAVFMSKQI